MMGRPIGTTTTAAGGAWTFTTSPLPAGSYSFVATATDAAGNVSANSAVFDPVVGEPNSSVEQQKLQIDLPNLSFVAPAWLGSDASSGATLALTPNRDQSGGTLCVTEGSQTANIALLANYMASSFIALSDGMGGTLVTSTPPLSADPPSLTAAQHH